MDDLTLPEGYYANPLQRPTQICTQKRHANKHTKLTRTLVQTYRRYNIIAIFCRFQILNCEDICIKAGTCRSSRRQKYTFRVEFPCVGRQTFRWTRNKKDVSTIEWTVISQSTKNNILALEEKVLPMTAVSKTTLKNIGQTKTNLTYENLLDWINIWGRYIISDNSSVSFKNIPS